MRYSNELSEENFELSTPWKEIQISIRTLKGILDTYMFIFFVRVFFHLKREKESKAKKQISPLQRFLLYSTVGIGSINMYHAVSSLTFFWIRYVYEESNALIENDPTY